MPQKNKKPAPFMTFVKEYQKKNPKLKLEEAIGRCNSIWQGMSQKEKDAYKSKSKMVPMELLNREKYTSQGVPLSMLDNEKIEQEKKVADSIKEITETVFHTKNVGTLADQKYYIIMGNYFYHQLQGDIFFPAEIAICEYSLNRGVTRKYHSLLNPKNDIFGYRYEAQTHSKNTHGLPLPPNEALGETELGKIYLRLYEFLSKSGYSKVPPVYTYNKNIRIVESMLLYMKDQCDVDTDKIRVFPLQRLFYELKKVTSEIGNTRQLNSIHITNAVLDQDYYEHQSGIACEFHERMDKNKYCALSYVVRWAYTFSDNICADLNIDMQPGYHIPLDIDMTLIAPNLSEGYCSRNTEEFSKDDEQQYNYVTKETNEDDSATTFISFSSETSSNDVDEPQNPWAVRSKLHIPPVDEESFNFSHGSVGRGRGSSILHSLNGNQSSLCRDSNSSRPNSSHNTSSLSLISQRICGRGKPLF